MDRLYIIGKDPVPQRIVLSKPGESLSLTLAVLPGVSCELAMQIDLDAEGCSVDLAGLYVCKGDENVRLDVNLRHNVPGCKSRQLFKGVVGGSARAEFDGLVYVARDAQQTEAYQENHSLLLSPEAVCETHPQLEIYADDVKCSHGATTGYLNPDELFYMRSRGIPEEEARRLQIISFLSPVVARHSELSEIELW